MNRALDSNQDRGRASWRRFASPALALVLVAGGAGGLASAGDSDVKKTPEAAVDVANSLSTAFRSAAAKIDPSVVSIAVTKQGQTPVAVDLGGMPFGDDMFKRFFGEMAPHMAPKPKGQRAPVMPKIRGAGSGVIVTEDGKILTNNHVVEGADSIRVKLFDGREFDAKLVGADPETDLAVVEIKTSGLTPAKIGDSETLLPGDWVVAVGSPFGLEHTVTAGVVSAKSRGDVGLNTYEDFIQTDAAINPGNSGGPLINLKGEVVGINSAIRSAGGGNNGIGFAIPSSTFEHVMGSLIASGKVERGWLGVSTQPLTEDLATSLSAESPKGALVSDVIEDTPAARAGLKSGDIITGLNGRPVSSPRDLVNIVGGLSPGEKAELEVWRHGDSRLLSVELGTRPSRVDLASAVDGTEPGTALGMSLQPLTAELAKQMGLKERNGVLVSEVQDGSPAAEAGIEAGDVILEAGGDEVSAPGEVIAAAKKGDEKGLLLKVRHQNSTRFVVVKQNG